MENFIQILLAAASRAPNPVAQIPLMDASDIIAIIGALTTSVVAVIAALASLKTGGKIKDLRDVTVEQADQASVKLDDIQEKNNGQLARVQGELADAKSKIERLYTLVAVVSPNVKAIEHAADVVPKVEQAIGSPPAGTPDTGAVETQKEE